MRLLKTISSKLKPNFRCCGRAASIARAQLSVPAAQTKTLRIRMSARTGDVSNALGYMGAIRPRFGYAKDPEHPPLSLAATREGTSSTTGL